MTAKAKQQRLPGMTPKHIVEIEEAADELKDLRSKRMTLATDEEAAQAKLVELMKKHDLAVYSLGEDEDGIPHEVVIKGGEPRAFVRRVKQPKARKEDREEEAAE